MSRFKGWTPEALSRLTNCVILDSQIPKNEANKSKYGSVSTDYDENKYQSKLEANEAMKLDWRLRTGDILKWERQVAIPLTADNVPLCRYFIDFVAVRLDGRNEYIEVKGKALELWKLKWKLFKIWIRENDPDAVVKLVYKDRTEIIDVNKC